MSEHIFVARERELARLQMSLDHALAGQGTVCFVTGEAGAGKTALVTEFARRAQDIHTELLVTIGDCNAQTGIGDPYLPFREVLGMLTGDVERELAQGTITEENAGRLRDFVRVSGQALVDLGPDLVEVFVPGVALATRAGAFLAGKVGWLDRLEELTERKATDPSGAGIDQDRIFEQYTTVLQALSGQQPLILVLDDLHWADTSSISLLFHLTRRLDESRILMVGSYRPDDVALGRRGDRHPLEPVVNELKRYHGDVWVDLGQTAGAEGRQFVDAYLDAEPNRLDEDFRQALYQHTRGHPLFTLQLVRDMRERGNLVQDEAGRWVKGPLLDWETLPAQVEGVIEERTSRLEDDLRESLTVASVEGEEFTAQVVARIRGIDDRELTRRLTRDLDRQHRLVREQGVTRVGRQRLGHYRFRHALFQKYLYDSLGQMERMYLHEDVGNVLETLYGDQADSIAVQLGWHFQEAGIAEKAVGYLLQAGQRAIQLLAFQEAIAHLTQGLVLRASLPDTPEIVHTEFELHMALGEARRRGGQLAEAMETFQQAASIARAGGSPEDLARAALGFEQSRWRFNLPADTSVQLLEEALSSLGENDNVLKVRVLGGLVRALISIGQREQVPALVQQAVELARRVDAPLALYDTLYISLFANRQPETIDQRIATVTERLRLAQEIDDKERTMECYGSRIHEYLERGDIQAMDADLEIHIGLAAELQQPFFLYSTEVYRSTQSLLTGRFSEAERRSQHALEIGQRMGVENVDGTFGVQMFTIRREQGRLREFAPVVKYFVERHSASAAWRPGLALIYSDLGLREEAQAEFERLAEDDFGTLPRDALWAASLAYLSEVCAFLGDTDRAATLYRLLKPYAGLNIVVGFAAACFGAASRYLGLLAATMSRWEEAETHFEDALEMNARMGARPWLAHTQHQYAVTLLAQGNVEDRDKAMSLLDEAHAIANELGMTSLVERVEALQATNT